MKQAFTMIELIFVIVVLGILSSVAIQKFVGIENDAKVASEKTTIAGLKTAISVINAKSMINKGDISIQTDSPINGTTRSNIWVTTSSHNFPLSVSVSKIIQNINSKQQYPLTFSDVLLDNGTNINGAALALLLSFNSRENFMTGQMYVKATSTDTPIAGDCTKTSYACRQFIEGPATRKDSGVSTQEVDMSLYSIGAWAYDPVNGIIEYQQKTDLTSFNIDDSVATNKIPNF